MWLVLDIPGAEKRLTKSKQEVVNIRRRICDLEMELERLQKEREKFIDRRLEWTYETRDKLKKLNKDLEHCTKEAKERELN